MRPLESAPDRDPVVFSLSGDGGQDFQSVDVDAQNLAMIATDGITATGAGQITVLAAVADNENTDEDETVAAFETDAIVHGDAERSQVRVRLKVVVMVASIGKIVSPAQGVSYYERDGYYARDDPAHREASAWAGKGAEGLGLSGAVDPDTFTAILEGKVPGRSQLGRRDKDGNILHRPGRDVTLSAPKSVSLAALVCGDERIVAAHDHAVQCTLARRRAASLCPAVPLGRLTAPPRGRRARQAVAGGCRGGTAAPSVGGRVRRSSSAPPTQQRRR